MALDYTDALAELTDMVAASTDPALSTAELRRLLRYAQVADADGNLPDTYAIWTAQAAQAINRLVVPSIRNGYAYKATTAGTSGANEPTWPTTIAATVADGTVVWTCLEAALWTPAYDRMALNLSAAEGWRIKAGRLTDNETFSTDGAFVQAQLRRGDMLEMAKTYRRKYIGVAPMQGRVYQGHYDPETGDDILPADFLYEGWIVNR
jgi:hypothetical protein